eukprot:scaffold1225_cov164-Amphora_coffeaeformis.AAC.14
MTNRDALLAQQTSGVGAPGFCLPAPQEFRSYTRGSRDIRRSYTRKQRNNIQQDTSTASASSSSTTPGLRRRPQHLIHERMNQLPSSEPIYLDLSSPPASPPATPKETVSRSERIRRRLSGKSASLSSSSSPSSSSPPTAASPEESKGLNGNNNNNSKSVTASREKSWWKRASDSSVPTFPTASVPQNNEAEQIFYMAAEDGGSVMTGMSQQELLRKKARSESKKRNKFFGSSKKKRKKNPIVSLPPGLLSANGKKEAGKKFYSSSSMPSDHGSTNNNSKRQQQPAATMQGRSTATTTAARSSRGSPNDSPQSASSGSELWKTQWGLDEKESATTADSTFTDSLPTIQKTPSMEMPYSTMPETTWAVMNETEGNLFLQTSATEQQRPPNHKKGDDNCSIDEYSFPLLSTGALGGILDDVVHQQQQREAMFESERGLESIPEIKERPSTISMSRSEGSGRVRFSATAELSTIVSSEEGVTTLEMDESGDFDVCKSTSYMSYQIDLDSPISVAEILYKSASYNPTPTKRRRKPKSTHSPVQSILRPAKYGDRNGKEMGGLKKAYIRAMSYWKASQILHNRRSSFEEHDDFQKQEGYASEGLTWIPAVAEEQEQLRFVDPNGAELSPIREGKPSSISETNSKSEDWSEYEDSETMQRLHFIEAVAAVVIQTAYRRHRALTWVNALRHEVLRSRLRQKNYADEMRQGGSEQEIRTADGSSMPHVETVRSDDSGNMEELHDRSLNEPRSPSQSWDGCVSQPESPQSHSPRRRDQREATNVEAGPRSLQSPSWNGHMSESVEQSPRGPLQYQSSQTDESPRHPFGGIAEYGGPRLMRKQALLDEALGEDEGAGVVSFPVQGQKPTNEDTDHPNMERQASWDGEGIPYRVQRRTNSNESLQPAVSSKPSFADSVTVSEITMDIHSTCIEEPKRKSVSEYIHDMEGEGNRKQPSEEVVRVDGQAVRIFASTACEGNETKAAPVKRTEGIGQGRNDWRKSWVQSPHTGPAKSVPDDRATRRSVSSPGGSSKTQDDYVKLLRDGSFDNAVKPRSLPSPQRKSPKKDSSSVSSYGDTESSYAGHLLVHDQAVPEEDTPENLFFDAAVKIQSVFRGFWVRDCINVDHYCAMVIQKAFRGYLCRVNFQYDRYRIVLVQSIWRRSIARSDVAHVLACAILLQAVTRGFLYRKNRARGPNFAKRDHSAALVIQCSWRRFWCESVLIRTLVDVLISQSVVRGWLARQKLKRLKSSSLAQKPGLPSHISESAKEKEQSVKLEHDDNAPDDEKSSDAGGSQKGTSQGSLAGSTTSSESSLHETPPKILARVTQTRSARGPPGPPSSGIKGVTDSSQNVAVIVHSLRDDDDESEPGFIPVVRRAPSAREGIPRDGRPPISPGRVKSSKLVERYETGLRQAEKDRKDSTRTSSRGPKSHKVQIIPPVDVEDVFSPHDSIEHSEESFDDISKDCDTSAVATESSRADSETAEDVEAQRVAEVKAQSKNKRIEESITFVENLPEDHPYKGYYMLWAEHGLFFPRNASKATIASLPAEGSHSSIDSDEESSLLPDETNAANVEEPSLLSDEMNAANVEEPSSVTNECPTSPAEMNVFNTDAGTMETSSLRADSSATIGENDSPEKVQHSTVAAAPVEQIPSSDLASMNRKEDATHLGSLVQRDSALAVPETALADSGSATRNDEDSVSISRPEKKSLSGVPDISLADSESLTGNGQATATSRGVRTSPTCAPKVSVPECESASENDDKLHENPRVDSAPSPGVSKLLQALSGLKPTKSGGGKVSSPFVPSTTPPESGLVNGRHEYTSDAVASPSVTPELSVTGQGLAVCQDETMVAHSSGEKETSPGPPSTVLYDDTKSCAVSSEDSSQTNNEVQKDEKKREEPAIARPPKSKLAQRLSQMPAIEQNMDDWVKSDPTPSVASSSTKSVVVYPEGFEPKLQRRKVSTRSESSEEKKDSDSLPGISQSNSGESKAIDRLESEDASSRKSFPGAEQVDSIETETKAEIIKTERNATEKVISSDDPHFFAYSAWYEKGLLAWKPVVAGKTEISTDVADPVESSIK